MNDLINKLIAEAGISQEQATKSIEVVKAFVKEKFPMMADGIENMFTHASSGQAQEGGSLLDKISDIIPGDIGEKIEGFAKQAKEKFEGLEGKL